MFPLVIMTLLVAVNFAISDVTPDSEIVMAGHWESDGIYGVWHNTDTDSKYYCGTPAGVPIKPWLLPDEEFGFHNSDTGKTVWFDDLAAFEASLSVVIPGPTNWLDINIIWGILIVALGVGVVVSAQVVGTGISEFGQKMIFTVAIYGSFWAFLTLGTSDLILSAVMGVTGTLIYIALTISYVIGLSSDVMAGE